MDTFLQVFLAIGPPLITGYVAYILGTRHSRHEARAMIAEANKFKAEANKLDAEADKLHYNGVQSLSLAATSLVTQMREQLEEAEILVAELKDKLAAAEWAYFTKLDTLEREHVTLLQKYEALKTEIARNNARITGLERENAALRDENAGLRMVGALK